MKFSSAVMLFLVAVAPFSLAGEVMESLKTRGGREYLKVEVLTVDDVGIRIRHDAGTARISFQDLPDSLQSKYHFDRKKSEAAKVEELKNQAEHEKSFQPPPEAVVPKKKPVPKTAAPTSKAAAAAQAQELENLEAYLADMSGMVKTKTAEAEKLRNQATIERSRTRSVTKGYTYNSRSDMTYPNTSAVPDKSGYAKADQYDEDAATLERQVVKARILIGEAEAKRAHLSGTD